VVGFVIYRLSFFPFLLSSFIGLSLLFNLRFVSLAFLFVSIFYISISSGSFCRVAEIGFKVFSLGFGQRWF